MKKVLLAIVSLLLCGHIMAQSASGSKALTWKQVGNLKTVNDVYGNTVDLPAWIDSGFCVIIDYSAVWCGPCWMVHSSGILEYIYEKLGPNGDNTVRMVWCEIQGASLSQITSSSYGNWTVTSSGDPVPYPVVSNASYIQMCNSLFDGAIPYVTFVGTDKQYTTIYNDYPDVVLDDSDKDGTIERLRAMVAEHGGRQASIAETGIPDFNVYPNPTSGMLHIDGQLRQAEVMDMSGRVLLSSSSNDIDLGGMTPGLYLLRVSSDAGQTVKKVVVR